jgi:DNA segregation ATPase FtsK/SpoIIIE, S-DNA-T family
MSPSPLTSLAAVAQPAVRVAVRAKSQMAGMESHELVVMSGPDSGAVHGLHIGRQSLGRSQAAGICIADPMIETHHAIISWDPPELQVSRLGGDVQAWEKSLRVGNSFCDVRSTVPIVEGPPRIFHRPPPIAEAEVHPPHLEIVPTAPSPVRTPPLSAVMTGLVIGVLLAVLTKHMLFGLFAVVTAVVAGLTWVFSLGTHHRAVKRWQKATDDLQQRFNEECREFLYLGVLHQQRRHRLLGDLLGVAQTGSAQLWEYKKIDEVCIGRGSRTMRVTTDSTPVEIHDVPITTSLRAGEIVGIFGAAAQRLAVAIIIRLAVEVGPSDWELIAVEPLCDEWPLISSLAHVRKTPLDKQDLDHVSTASKHRILLVTNAAVIASRTCIARRILASGEASILVVASDRSGLPNICTQIIDANVSHALGSWIDPDCDGSMLLEKIDFETLLCDGQVTAAAISRRWSDCEARSMIAVMGASSDGTIAIDFDSDGPHAVVVGTTGSGKSEFLRTLILALAVRSSPSELNFVLIDYKGGAAFDACTHLPHVVGVITDLDSGLAERVLTSLEAELRYRERELRDFDKTLPRLVVVVDELAALAVDVPEFIGSLVSIAQRGRSLGVHLIVATQRPGAALSADVLANANIRVALRVQSVHDSREIVGSGVAAGFTRDVPGRAAMRLGPNDLYIFQTAMIAGNIADIVEVIAQASELNKSEKPRRPWLDPLPAVLMRANVCENADESNFSQLHIGMLDDPSCQRQFNLTVDLSQHVLVTGNSRSGKSSLLKLMREIIETSVMVYTIAGTGNSDHSKNEIDLADRELVQRLLDHCLSKIVDDERHQSSSTRIVLLIDDIDVWRNHFLEDRLGLSLWAMMQRVIIEGPAHGITCVLTMASGQSLPAILSSRVRQKWQLDGHSGGVIGEYEGRLLRGQLFFHTEVEASDQTSRSQKSSVVRHLGSRIATGELRQRGAWGVFAKNFEEVCLRPLADLAMCVVGHVGSGRTTVLDSIMYAWQAQHADGRVLSVGDFSERTVEQVREISLPVLLVVDDVESLSSLSDEWMQQFFMHQQPKKNISLLIAVPPVFLRSRGEHWVQQVRRSRTGFLLGECAEHDADLFGVYSTSPSVYQQGIGRGLLVQDGVSQGIVQAGSSAMPPLSIV